MNPMLGLSLSLCLWVSPAVTAGAVAIPHASAVDDAPTTEQSLGYYRMPAMRGQTIVFVAEGDLWRVGTEGGIASRLTSHPGEERDPSISPDGTMVAFTATYEGPREVYTMPLNGGLPTRRTWDAGRAGMTGWMPDGTLLYATDARSALPAIRVWRHDCATDQRTVLPLAQCSDATFIDATHLAFTRLQFQGSHTDRYQGGTAQQLWSFDLPAGASGTADEAKPLTADYDGTSRRPLAWGDRIVFTTDRSGRLNLWSMRRDGTDLRQHTKHADFDIGSSAIDGQRVVYQLGPDLWVHDLVKGSDAKLEVRLASDFDQLRERWLKDPATQANSVHLSPDGDRIVLTIRGRVFVVPVKQGRTVDADRRGGIRYREARFMPDGSTLVAVSDESGELEVVMLPANGLGEAQRKTTDSNTVRWRAIPSPDGKRIAHTDKRQRLWVLEVESGVNTLVEENAVEQIGDTAWSHDSQWLAYVSQAANMNQQIRLWPVAGGPALVATSDRYDSYRPQWSVDGKFLYFVSDRNFESLVGSPWGPRAPEPFFAETGRLFELALKPGARSPFQPDDEVFRAEEKRRKEQEKIEKEKEKDKPTPPPATDGKSESLGDGPAKVEAAKPEGSKADAGKGADKAPAKVEIEAEGLATRLEQLPVKATSFGRSPLVVTDDAIFWIAFTPDALPDEDAPGGGNLMGLAIGNEKPEPKTVLAGVRTMELSADRKKLLVQKEKSWYVIDAKPVPATLEKAGIDLGAISLAITPQQEWQSMMVDAWRLLRDYFYDRKMHGVLWKETLAKYRPWVDRVRSREELADVFQEMTGELSALHHFVNGGDMRDGQDKVGIATLGAELERDESLGGWRVTSIPESDPDEPTMRSPLIAPTVRVEVGDVVVAIDGTPTLSVPHPSVLLRNKAGRQTLLSVRPKGSAEPREVIVRPMTSQADAALRYRSWEVTRRREVERQSNGDIGYVHLRAMGGEDMADFVRDFYPVFNRRGLIIDVRHNRGGNIDSWVLSRLMRKAWMYWNQHAGRAPNWNMQYAFRGHMVVLCNERTASDGEAFSEGFRRLGLGKVMGMRTWGGEIWLSSSNTLVDGGLVSAGEYGVFDDDGVWLIEGRGVEPDVVIDNLPHATFNGEDAQLKAAIEHLQQLIKNDPRDIPPVPPTPLKAAGG
ncbi:MAG: PD40 domain-containing protein [Phycisphaerae bacterium]|nr:PD40 domain-containing protein [Phycisphaerae bacterium]